MPDVTFLTEESLVKWLRRACGDLDDTQLNATDARELLNMAWWNIEGNYDFKEKECTRPIPLVDGQEAYGIPPSLDALQGLYYIDEDGRSHKLIQESRLTWDEERNEDEDSRGVPRFWHRWRNNIYLRPIPGPQEDGLTLRANYLRALSSLVAQEVSFFEVPRKWLPAIITEAQSLYHGFKREYELATAALNLRNIRVREHVPTEAKEQRDMHWAGVQVPDEWPGGSGFREGTNGFNEF